MFMELCVVSTAEGGLQTGWDRGPFTAVCAPGQTPPGAVGYKETIRD